MEYRFKSKYGYIRVEATSEVEAENRYANLMVRLAKANAEIAKAFKDNQAYLEREEQKGPVH